MFNENGTFEYILNASNSFASVRGEVETELRVRQDLMTAVKNIHRVDTSKPIDIEGRDSYFVLESGVFYVRVRDHTVDGDRTLKGNVKIPFWPNGYGGINTPHAMEFTWDLDIEEYTKIMSNQTPVVTVDAHRYGVKHIHGPSEIKMAFDNVASLGQFTQFTEVSEEIKPFEDIPYARFKILMANVINGSTTPDGLANLLLGLGPNNGLLGRLQRAEDSVRGFIFRMGLSDSDLESRSYPDIVMAEK